MLCTTYCMVTVWRHLNLIHIYITLHYRLIPTSPVVVVTTGILSKRIKLSSSPTGSPKSLDFVDIRFILKFERGHPEL